MNFAPVIPISIDAVKSIILMIAYRHLVCDIHLENPIADMCQNMLERIGVTEVEIKVLLMPSPDQQPTPYRLIVSNPVCALSFCIECH